MLEHEFAVAPHVGQHRKREPAALKTRLSTSTDCSSASQGVCRRQRLRFLKELSTPHTLRTFRASWKDNNLAALKKLERMRSFCRFGTRERIGFAGESSCQNQQSESHLAADTSFLAGRDGLRILAAVAKRIEECQSHGRDNARRLRALVLLLRYSGLRIGDAVGCSVERLANGKLRLYAQKTGTHVHCPLPEFVVKELGAIPKKSERYWFWTGNGKLETAVADWQGRLLDVFTDLKIEEFARTHKITTDEARKQIGKVTADGHPHRFQRYVCRRTPSRRLFRWSAGFHFARTHEHKSDRAPLFTMDS